MSQEYFNKDQTSNTYEKTQDTTNSKGNGDSSEMPQENIYEDYVKGKEKVEESTEKVTNKSKFLKKSSPRKADYGHHDEESKTSKESQRCINEIMTTPAKVSIARQETGGILNFNSEKLARKPSDMRKILKKSPFSKHSEFDSPASRAIQPTINLITETYVINLDTPEQMILSKNKRQNVKSNIFLETNDDEMEATDEFYDYRSSEKEDKKRFTITELMDTYNLTSPRPALSLTTMENVDVTNSKDEESSNGSYDRCDDGESENENEESEDEDSSTKQSYFKKLTTMQRYELDDSEPFEW